MRMGASLELSCRCMGSGDAAMVRTEHTRRAAEKCRWVTPFSPFSRRLKGVYSRPRSPVRKTHPRRCCTSPSTDANPQIAARIVRGQLSWIGGAAKGR
jgi:hypothetical protein